MKRKGKRKVAIVKEEVAEDWCFVCKDGGDVRICDYKECLKSYHPRCVEKENSFLESESRWNCPWHTCSVCSKAANHHCYTCVYSLCGRCIRAGAFVQVKGKSGFCRNCLTVALLIEENKEYNSDGEKVDFTDQNTVEGLFKEYYLIIQKDEGFELTDLYAAKDRMKMEKKIQSSSEEFDEDDDEGEEQVSDYDDMENGKKPRRTRKEKRSKKQKSAARSPMKSNKMEFIGWGSKPLIEFLASVGKSSSEKLSQYDVSFIVHGYIRENKLLDRKTVICDALLQSLFNKKTISKFKVSDLLLAHFTENQDESEDEELDYDSENDNPGTSAKARSIKKLPDTEKKNKEKEIENGVSPQSRFASIVDENVKLVYLKKSLLYELLKQTESFEEKVIGSYVRVKVDPYDYCAKSSHQLVKVKGVKTVSVGVNEKETVLLLSGRPKESRISLLSDDKFSEAECEDLRQKVQAGLLDRPTMVELQRKANLLHKDITQHWISKELALLQKLIDRANEKGWRRELFGYLDQKKMLESPQGRERLLNSVPTVIPDLSELETNSVDKKHEMEIDEESPKSTLQCDSSSPIDEWHKKAKSENTHHGHASRPKKTIPRSEFEPDDTSKTDPLHLTAEEKTNILETSKNREPSKLEVIEILSDDENSDDDGTVNNNPVLTHQQKFENPETGTSWCAVGPNGEREKCSLSVLKSWSESCTYASKFKVWKEDENEEKAMWLLDAINIAFPQK